MDRAPLFYVLATATVIFVLFKLSRVGKRPSGFPPGPPTLPLLGNLHQFPRKDLHLTFQKWTQEYGPLVGLKLGTQNVILLGSGTVVSDLLEKKSGNNSSRMDILFREFGNDMNIFFRPYDDVWKRQRKVYHVRLNSTLANNYLPYQYFETSQLLHGLLEAPEDFRNHLERFTISIGATIAYGKRIPSAEAPEVKILIEWFRRTVIAGTSLQVADWWPILRPIVRAVPYRINPIKQYLGKLERMENDLWSNLVAETKAHIEKGRYYPSLCRDMILSNESGKDKLSECELRYNSGHAWAAATDTQSNTLLSFVKAMVLYPEVQARARKEVDDIAGDRLPEWSDRANMPYLRRCVEETLRWQPTTLTGGPMPHASMKDEVYMGYSIPARTGLMNCVWTVNNDPARHENPREFDPERFSEEDSRMDAYSITQNYEKRPHLTFGAGRRICPGSHVADRTLFIAMARLLWAFQFNYKLKADGRPIPIEKDAFTAGVVVGPAPYQCEIKPRSEAKSEMVRRLYRETLKDLDESGNYTEEFFRDNWKAKDVR